MSENRIRIQKQLEKSLLPNSVIVTDINNEPRYETLAALADNSLPSPQWRKGTKQVQMLWDGSGTVECDSFYVKVPRVKQSLIDDGVLFVQFGRLTKRCYSEANGIGRVRMKGIKWYTPCDASNAPIYGGGSGEICGRHNGNAMARPNLIPVTAQNQTITQALPIWAFYGTKQAFVLNGDISNVNGVSAVVGVPYLSGTGKRASGMYDPTFYHNTGPLRTKRPKRPMWRSNDHARSVWYSRLVVISNGRVVSYGSVSEAVIVRPNQMTFSTETMSSMFVKADGNYQDSGYTFYALTGDIQSNYRD